MIYRSSDLDIDMDAYKQNLTYGAQMAFNLAVFATYMTPQTAVPIVQKARMQALSLATYAGILTKDTTDLVLSKAYGGMLALARLMSSDGLDTLQERTICCLASPQSSARSVDSSALVTMQSARTSRELLGNGSALLLCILRVISS